MSLPVEFKHLSDQDRNTLENYLDVVNYPTGGCLFRAGDDGVDVILIDSGTVRLEFDTEELDTEKVVSTLGEGEMFGELALLDEKGRSLSAYAETELKVRRLTIEALHKLVEEHSKLGANVYAALGRSAANKLRLSTAKMSDFLSESFAVHPEVEIMVDKAKKAQLGYIHFSDRHIDELLYDICQILLAHSKELAEDAVKETRVGNANDKDSKHINTCLGIYNDLVGKSGAGIVKHNRLKNVREIVDSMGVIFGLVPVTNPVSTVIFKSLITLKSRNSIILSPNRLGSKVAVKTVDLILPVLTKHGLNKDVIQVVRERQSRQMTAAFMRHNDVSLVLATGGSGMVKAAYSSGTPAIGVGPGNAPCFIASDAKLAHAASSIVKSKSFDNGLICGAEHNLIVEDSIYSKFVQALEDHGAAVLTTEEKKHFMSEAISSSGALSRRIIGQDVDKIAKRYDIKRDYPIRLIVVPSDETVSSENPLLHEKMAPVLSLVSVKNRDQGLLAAETILDIEGCGHTAVIHTQSTRIAKEFGLRVKASRILVNSPCVQGIIGMSTGLTASLTLGCGSYGGNSTTDNITYTHLLNVKRMAYFLPYKKVSDLLDRSRHVSPRVLYMLKLLGSIRRILHR